MDKETLDRYPDKPGVYLMKDEEGRMLYIGKANHLRARLRQYFAGKGDERAMIPHLLGEIASVDTIVVLHEKDALILENTLIKKHQPKYNVLLKDDKTFIRLLLTKHEYPLLKISRGKKIPKEAKHAFGPYTNAKAARQTYDLIQKLFPLRQCSDAEFASRTRPCLLYDIKRCVAPCVGKCTKDDYDLLVDAAKKLLQGKDRETLKDLQEKMEKAAEEMQFEKAASLRDLIHHIEHVLTVQHVDIPEAKECDVLGFYRESDAIMFAKLLFREGKLTSSEHFSFHQILSEDKDALESFVLQHYGPKEDLPKEILLPLEIKSLSSLQEILSEHAGKTVHLLYPQKGKKKELLEIARLNAESLFKRELDARSLKEKMLLDLQESLHLSRYPRRIECIDTSHLSGSHQVASLVVFVNGEREKTRQRNFHIRSAKEGDDYGAIREVLLRHFTKAKENHDFCDLLVIDGGKGHLRVALEVFQELNIASVDVIGLAKQDSLHTKGLTQEKIFLPHQKDPLLIPARSPLLFLLQKIRDEAHRVAILSQQKRRTKTTFATALDQIPGIGPLKKKVLLKHFGSVKQIANATREELEKVKGLHAKDVEAILAFFRGKKA